MELLGTNAEPHGRQQTLELEAIARIWAALGAPYPPSVSYEVSLVDIATVGEADTRSPVMQVHTGLGPSVVTPFAGDRNSSITNP